MERLELRVPPPVVTLVSALLMWGLRGAVPSLVWLVPGRAWLAGVLVGTGMMLGLWAVWSFRRQRTTINPHNIMYLSTLFTFDGSIFIFY